MIFFLIVLFVVIFVITTHLEIKSTDNYLKQLINNGEHVDILKFVIFKSLVYFVVILVIVEFIKL